MDYRSEIKSIIAEELNYLINRITIDFVNNFNKKIHNWTLARFDKLLVANMVFVSSFESKSGNMFQSISRKIAKLRYGEENVPNVLQGFGVSDEEFEEHKSHYEGSEQVIITKLDMRYGQDIIAAFMQKHKARGRGTTRTDNIHQETLQELRAQEFLCGGELHFKPVDLAIFNPQTNKYSIFEIKAGGALDSSNAPGNITKLLTLYVGFGKSNVDLFFATLYNKNGEGNVWTGAIKAYLANDMLVIGKNFWEYILPEGFTFEDFKDVYSEVVVELSINDRINQLIT